MNLYYDFQKMTIISMALVAVSLNIGLLMQYGHGQNITMTQEQRKAIIDYCFQHADRLNPLQDLIDKGFLPLMKLVNQLSRRMIRFRVI
jgi:hypothetical protein